jgi:4-hydroxy-tetrahydrodipicolinate synthase
MTDFLIKGFVPAIATPFNENGDLMFDAFERLLDWQLSIGVDGICIAGDNGEAWTLSPDERRALVRLAVTRVNGRVPIVLGATATSNRQAARYAEIAAEEGASAVLLMPQPYVLKATRAELLARFEYVAREVAIPIVAYNTPRRSGISLSVDDIAALCGVAPVIALKESAREVPHITRVIERLGSSVAIMTGPANCILWAGALGAAGFIATGPELMGRHAASLMKMAAGAPDEAYRTTQFRLNAIYEALMGIGTWPASLKAALKMIGLPAGVPREPVQPLSREDHSTLMAVLEACDIAIVDRDPA